MITKHIARIKNPAVRVPLWSLWFPFLLVDHIGRTFLAGEWSRFGHAAYWRWVGLIYLIGIHGALA